VADLVNSGIGRCEVLGLASAGRCLASRRPGAHSQPRASGLRCDACGHEQIVERLAFAAFHDIEQIAGLSRWKIALLIRCFAGADSTLAGGWRIAIAGRLEFASMPLWELATLAVRGPSIKRTSSQRRKLTRGGSNFAPVLGPLVEIKQTCAKASSDYGS
jgi:hypothetical protein